MQRSRRRPLILAALAAAALLALCVAGCGPRDAAKTLYHCPMHPTYVADHPGDCPICGMKLVPIEATPAAAATPPPAAHDVYTCPMHPEVVSDKPGKCPICHMDLVLKTTAAAPADSPPPGVPGLAPVTLAPGSLELAGVQTYTAAKTAMGGVIRTIGTVVADETRVRHLHVKTAGYVEKLYVNSTGQLVRRGQPLVGVYSPDLLASQQEYVRARETEAKFAKSALPEVQTGGKELVQAARRRLELFDAPKSLIDALDAGGQPQRVVVLSAPVAGYVTSKEVYEGHRVEPGEELFTVTDLSRVWIEGDFYEYEARQVRVGQEAKLTLAYDASAPLVAKVAYVYPTLDPASRTLKARFEAANPQLTLKPGMFANVELAVAASEGVAFPDSAVLDTGARQVVFVETQPGRFEPREVRLVNRAEGMAQVQSGVAAGEKVVVRANFLLDSESRLKAALLGAGQPAGQSP